MKILVPIKRVADPYGRIPHDGRTDDADIKWVINPFDEIALEEAVRIREGSADQIEIVAVTVGPAGWEDQLRAALAMGADRAIHVVYTPQDALYGGGGADCSVVATLLASVWSIEKPDLTLLGKQAIDDDAGQTGQRLAALLKLPLACFASRVEITGRDMTVTREVDAGRETVSLSLPAVITTDLRLNEPRYISLPAIIKARSKQVQKLDAAELGCDLKPGIRLLRLEQPPARKAGRRVASVQELVSALRDEAGVL